MSGKLKDLSEIVLAKVMRHLPITWAARLGGYLGARQGRKGIAAGRVWVRRLHNNLEALCGITDPQERERRIVEHTRRVGQVYAEIPIQDRIAAEGRLEIVGEENLRNLTKPVIIATCHLANWELIGRIPQLIGGSWLDIFLPLDNDVRARVAHEARQRWIVKGVIEGELIGASPSSLLHINRAIAKGSNLILFIDEEKNGYVWAPSLGRQIPYAGNRWFAARLAVRHNIDILPVYIEPAGLGSYRAIIEPRITAPSEGDAESKARSLADTLDQRLDSWVRKWPEHWYWLPLLDLKKSPPDYSAGK